MTWTPPASSRNLSATAEDVVSTDDILKAWEVTLSTGLVPSTAMVLVSNHIADVDVSDRVKAGAASVSAVVGSACTVSQRLTNFVAGTIYRCAIIVTTTTGLDVTFLAYLNCEH
jgi:hypothetical protein